MFIVRYIYFITYEILITLLLKNNFNINYVSLYIPLGVYNIEPLSDMSWSVLSYGLNVGYHFWIVQSVALVRMLETFTLDTKLDLDV